MFCCDAPAQEAIECYAPSLPDQKVWKMENSSAQAESMAPMVCLMACMLAVASSSEPARWHDMAWYCYVACLVGDTFINHQGMGVMQHD